MESSAPSKQVCPLKEDERFKKFYDLIPEIFRTYMANFVWTVGLLSVANGWFLSSTSSREFIRNSVSAYLAAILVVVAVGLLHTASCWMYYRRSQDRIGQLKREYENLSPLPFQDYEITRTILLVNLLVSWSLLAGLITLVIAAHTSPA
jgi:hypothetical protein